MHVAVFATLRAAEGCEQELTSVIEDLVEQSHEEPGTLVYAAHRHRKEPGVFWFYEVYEDAAALEEHAARAGARMAEFAHLLAERPQVSVVDAVADKGLGLIPYL